VKRVCLTFDLEERFHSDLTPNDSPRIWQLQDRISIILEWLDERKKMATFFTVGELAEKYPDLIKRIADSGHEIACHSYRHDRLSSSNIEHHKEDIRKTKSILEDISGKAVYGFRAPSWSAEASYEWLWDHLSQLGFIYDSSLFPFKTNLYGSLKNSVKPYWIREDLLEIPPTVHKIGPLRIPFSGGFYFRLLPASTIKFFTGRELSLDNTPLFYFHPWEFEPCSETSERSLFNKFVGNYNIKSNWSKFTSFFSSYPTITMNQFYELYKT